MAAIFMVDENSLIVEPRDEYGNSKTTFYVGDRIILHCECWANIHITFPTPTFGIWSIDFIVQIPGVADKKATDKHDYSGWDTHELAVADIDIGVASEAGPLDGAVAVKCYHM